MGFLDRMLGDLIQDSTGLPARRLVRAIGAKKLLAVGGAALAGAFAAEKLGQGQGQPAAGAPPRPPGGAPPPPPDATRDVVMPGGVTPPPPPSPHGAEASPPPAAPPPPPPPDASPPEVAPPSPPPADATPAAEADRLADEASPFDVLPQQVTYAAVRTMVAAALADGDLAEIERAAIERRLDDSGLDDEQVDQVHRDLSLPPSTRELAAMVEGQEARELLYRLGATVALADNRVSDLERAWLTRFGAALGFDLVRCAALQEELGL